MKSDRPKTLDVYCYYDDKGQRRAKVRGGVPKDDPNAMKALHQALEIWKYLTAKPTKVNTEDDK